MENSIPLETPATAAGDSLRGGGGLPPRQGTVGIIIPVFNEAAVQAALGWVFTPAMMNNGPVRVWAAVPFRFKLTR